MLSLSLDSLGIPFLLCNAVFVFRSSGESPFYSIMLSLSLDHLGDFPFYSVILSFSLDHLGDLGVDWYQDSMEQNCKRSVKRSCWCNQTQQPPFTSDVRTVVEVLLYVHRNRRLIRDGSPGRPPRLSHSSWNLPEQSHCIRKCMRMCRCVSVVC